jgi:hypothetical protein
MGDGLIFLKTSAPSSLMTTYRMSLISAGSISLNRTFKQNFYSLHRKKVGGADRAVEYEKLLVQWIEEKFYQIQVLQYCLFIMQFMKVPCFFMASVLFFWKSKVRIPKFHSLIVYECKKS